LLNTEKLKEKKKEEKKDDSNQIAGKLFVMLLQLND